MERRNIDWIDWLKALCMFFVYWNHVGIFSSNKDIISWLYGPFFVNGFFFVSGYLIFRKQLSDDEIKLTFSQYRAKLFQAGGAISNIVFKIAIPSIIFSMLLFVPRCLIRGESLELIFFLKTTVLRGTYWFTCSLFVSEIIIYLLFLTREKRILFYILISGLLALLGNYLINENSVLLGDEHLPWFYKSGLIASLFLSLGGVFYVVESRWESYMKDLKTHKILVFFLILSLYLITNVIMVKVLRVRCPASCLTGISLYGGIISLLAILSMIYLCKILKNFEFVKFTSRNTICFYFLSAIVPFASCKVFDKLLPAGDLTYFITVIISFLVASLIVFILNRYLPFLFDLRLISRKIEKLIQD